MQYESSITSGLKDMAKVKVFVHATDTDGRAMILAPWTYTQRRKLRTAYSTNDCRGKSTVIY